MTAAAVFSAEEDRRLRRLWVSMMPAAKIVAEMAPRRASEVFARIDTMLDPAAVSHDSDGVWMPLDLAELSLAGRAIRRPVPSRGRQLGWLLDGRPASDAQVVAAANRVRLALGYAPIPWPGTVPQQAGEAG